MKAMSPLFDPIVYSRIMCGMEPLSYQATAINIRPKSKGVILVCGRKIGKTKVIIKIRGSYDFFILPYKLMHDYNLSAPAPRRVLSLGHNKESAKTLSTIMKDLISSNEILSDCMESMQETYMRTTFGSELITRTVGTNADALRGAGADYFYDLDSGKGITVGITVIGDEAAFFRDPSTIFEVIEPMVSIGDDSYAMFITTPNGKSGEIYQAWTERTDWARLQFPSLVNMVSKGGYIEDEWLFNVRSRLFAAGLTSVWRQEYLGSFEDVSGIFFPWKTWVLAEDDDLEMWTDDYILNRMVSKEHGHFIMGIDANSMTEGRGNDNFAITIVEKVGSKAFLRYAGKWKTKPPEYKHLSMSEWMNKHIHKLCDKIDIREIWIGRGYGYGVYHMLNDSKLINAKVELFDDTTTSIIEGFTTLRTAMTCERFKMPGCKKLQDERATFVDLSVSESSDIYDNTPQRLTKKSKSDSSDLLFALMYATYPIFVDDPHTDYTISIGRSRGIQIVDANQIAGFKTKSGGAGFNITEVPRFGTN
jgi:hypothetical protein